MATPPTPSNASVSQLLVTYPSPGWAPKRFSGFVRTRVMPRWSADPQSDRLLACGRGTPIGISVPRHLGRGSGVVESCDAATSKNSSGVASVTSASIAHASVTRVVVVDDDLRFVEGVNAALGDAVDLRSVGSAHNVTAACAMISQLQPDVALIDLGLGQESGVAVISHARMAAPRCELLVLTLFEDDVTVWAAIEAGASGYVLKGGGPEELREHIRTVHAGGSPISPRIARRLLSRMGSPAATVGASAFTAPAETPLTADTALSTQELQMLQLAAKGCSHDEIARLMGVSRNTVLTYAKRCYRKLQVHSRAEAVYEARRMGLLRD